MCLQIINKQIRLTRAFDGILQREIGWFFQVRANCASETVRCNIVTQISIVNEQLWNKGVFSVARICSRTQDWPACVAPAKNNFICLFIVKRDKPMRDARHYPAAEHPHA
jgi:hypothetical protein